MVKQTPIILRRSIDTKGFITFDGEGGPWLDRIYALPENLSAFTLLKDYFITMGTIQILPENEKEPLPLPLQERFQQKTSILRYSQ